jgi:hypothetical protein
MRKVTSQDALQSIIRDKDDVGYGWFALRRRKLIGKEVVSSDPYRQICRMRFKI